MPFDFDKGKKRGPGGHGFPQGKGNQSSPYGSGSPAPFFPEKPLSSPSSPFEPARYPSPQNAGTDSYGFKNQPVSSPSPGTPMIRQEPYDSMRRPVRPPVRKRSTFSWSSLLQERILPILLIVAAIVLLYVFRNEISGFLTQVLSWVIIITILFIYLRSVLFRRRR